MPLLEEMGQNNSKDSLKEYRSQWERKAGLDMMPYFETHYDNQLNMFLPIPSQNEEWHVFQESWMILVVLKFGRMVTHFTFNIKHNFYPLRNINQAATLWVRNYESETSWVRIYESEIVFTAEPTAPKTHTKGGTRNYDIHKHETSKRLDSPWNWKRTTYSDGKVL